MHNAKLSADPPGGRLQFKPSEAPFSLNRTEPQPTETAHSFMGQPSTGVVADRGDTGHALRQRIWASLKPWRADGAGYEKTAKSLLGLLQIGAAVDGIG